MTDPFALATSNLCWQQRSISERSMPRLLLLTLRKMWMPSLTALLGGCAAVTSTRDAFQSSAAPKNGIFYFLPKSHVVVALSWNPVSRTWDVTPTVVYEADPNARFAIDWSNGILADKHTIVAVDPVTGLLQSANATYTGQAVNSVGSFVGAAPNILTLGPSSVAMGTDAGGFTSNTADSLVKSGQAMAAANPNGLAASTEVVLSDDGRTEAVARLASPEGQGTRFYGTIQATLTRRFDVPDDFPEDRKWRVAADGKAGGIVVRLPIPFELQVSELISADPQFRDETQPRRIGAIAPRIIMLPDSRHDFVYRVLTRPLVSDGTTVTLSNGMIETVEQVRPSMLTALIALPKYFVTAVAPLPIEINQTQQNISNAQSRVTTGPATAGPLSASGTAAESK